MMSDREFKDLIDSTLNLIPTKEKKIDWLVKQLLNLSQAHVSFKQKKRTVLILSDYINKQ